MGKNKNRAKTARRNAAASEVCKDIADKKSESSNVIVNKEHAEKNDELIKSSPDSEENGVSLSQSKDELEKSAEDKTEDNDIEAAGTSSSKDKKKKNKSKTKINTASQVVDHLTKKGITDCHANVAELIKVLGEDKEHWTVLQNDSVQTQIEMMSNYCNHLRTELQNHKNPEPDVEHTMVTRSGKRKGAKSKDASNDQELQKRIDNLEAENSKLKQSVNEAEAKVQKESVTNKKLNMRMQELEEGKLKDKQEASKLVELQRQDLLDKAKKIEQITVEAQNYQMRTINLNTSKENLEKNITEKDEELKRLKQELASMTESRDVFKERFSQVAGAKLSSGNAEITDLSDHNRPQKIAEKFSELYDNQWTDAFEELCDNGMSEEDTIKCLLETLKVCVNECSMKSEMQERLLSTHVIDDMNLTGHALPEEPICNGGDNKVEDSMLKQFNTLSIQDNKILKDLRKANGSRTLPVITKILKTEIAKQGQHTQRENFNTYIEKCVEICWFSSIQDPALEFDWSFEHGSQFDDGLLKPYTRNGTKVDFMVWPILRLYINGPLLAKGVVQPMS